MVIEDPKDKRRYYVLRTAYPQFLFRLQSIPNGKTTSVTVHKAEYHVEVVRDYNNYGEIPETYLKEMARFCYYNGQTDQVINTENVEHLLQIREGVDLKSIFEWVNGAFVAQDCFKKDRTWLYQRLNGNLVNGKTAEFNQDQKEALADYFRLKAQELIEVAKLLEK